MSNSLPAIQKLQIDANNPNISVSILLRTAKIIATKLDAQDALIWIDRELNGYLDLPLEALPKYRLVHSEPKWLNPYYERWQPIFFKDPKMGQLFSKTPIRDALGTIEEQLRCEQAYNYMFSWGGYRMRKHLTDAVEFAADAQVFISYAQLWDLINAVRNLVLNWSLDLEKAGILGESLIFTPDEKRSATAVTSQYFIQNVGVLGNVSGQAAVNNDQTATLGLDTSKVLDLLNQARRATPLLPSEIKVELDALLTEAETAAKSTQQPSRLRGVLESIKRVCEGAAGNVVASGIVNQIKSLLAG